MFFRYYPMKKLFGSLRITWPRLVVFALICGVYTGLMALLPAAKDTSFQDIAISFECWILFAILIIVNSVTALDAALKVIVFFLISQPLVYLVQVPFHPMGFGLFRYYPTWFRWTLLTFPMAFVGWYMKKDKWWGLLILGPVLVSLGYHYMRFLTEAIGFFPNHLLSTLFCAATMLLYPLAIFHDRKLRYVGLALSLTILLVFTALALRSGPSTYETDLMLSGGERAGTEFDGSWTVSLEDEDYGQVSLRYEEQIDAWMVHAVLTKTGHTRLHLRSPQGESFVYDLEVGRDTFEVQRISPTS